MTDFEKRIAAITGKRASLDDADAKKKQEQENRTQDLIDEIISMGDRIKAVIEIGKHLQRNHLLPKEGWDSYDKPLKKYGYDGAMRAEGIYHHVGFMARYSRVWADDSEPVCYLGIENGGANGKWDFYTDGTEVFHMHEKDYDHKSEVRPTKTPSIYDLEKFVREFPKFESALYAWIDNGMK